MKQKESYKDRKDGKRIKMLATQRMLCYLKPRRDADVYINKKIDVTELVQYMKKKKVKYPDTTYFHAFAIAIAKVVYNRPKMNYFIVNKRCYSRNDVTLSFVAKVNFNDEAQEYLSIIKVDKDDNIDKLRDKIKEKVNKVRSNTKNSTDNTVKVLNKLPKPIFAIVMCGLKFLDRHDLLPKSITSDSIYHSSVILSNLGSIKCGAIYHNITDFGTNSILVTMGDIHKEPIAINDKIEIRDVIEFGITLDERIGDGVYFAKAVNLLEHILKNPKLLEGHADDILEEKKDFQY